MAIRRSPGDTWTNRERILASIALTGGMTRKEMVELLEILPNEVDWIVEGLREDKAIKEGDMRRGWTVYVPS